MTTTTRTRQQARLVAGVAALLAAALLTAGAGLLTYGLTSEYGATPNGDLRADLLAGLRDLVPVLVLVGALVWLGLAGAAPRLPSRVRTGAAVAAALLLLAAAGGGTLVGQLALEQRCAERGPSSSAACPRSG